MSLEKMIADLNAAIVDNTAAAKELAAVLTAAASTDEPAPKPPAKKKTAAKKKVAKKPEPESEIEDEEELDLDDLEDEDDDDLLGLDDEDDDEPEGDVSMEELSARARELLNLKINGKLDTNGNKEKLVACMAQVGLKKVKDATGDQVKMNKLFGLIGKALK